MQIATTARVTKMAWNLLIYCTNLLYKDRLFPLITTSILLENDGSSCNVKDNSWKRWKAYITCSFCVYRNLYQCCSSSTQNGRSLEMRACREREESTWLQTLPPSQSSCASLRGLTSWSQWSVRLRHTALGKCPLPIKILCKLTLMRLSSFCFQSSPCRCLRLFLGSTNKTSGL